MLVPNTILQNRYRVLRLLGQGGMGAVYLAYDLRFINRQIVVKENIGGDPRQFQTEANLLVTLNHPNLARVSDNFIEPNGAQYLVMDYIEGQNLVDRVQQRGPLDESLALVFMRQILDAVRCLHVNRVVHRDIKPENIIITPDDKAVLVDFGIAKVIANGLATLTGARAVTPGYAPPEQYAGGTTERSDVYALGATFYYLLTGSIPLESPNRSAGVVLTAPRQINKRITAPTEAVILKAMDMNPTYRYASAGEMGQALHPVVAPTVAALPSVKSLLIIESIASLLLAFLIGLVFGLIVLGWAVFPVQWSDASASDLEPGTKATYIVLVADSYGQNEDLAAAKQRLAGIPNEDVAQALSAEIQKRNSIPGQANNAAALAQFANAYGVKLSNPAAVPVATPGLASPSNLATVFLMGSCLVFSIPFIGVIVLGVIIRRRMRARTF
ncbi:MAG: serine/threonine-protein kinase [Anaerolineae bacterium]